MAATPYRIQVSRTMIVVGWALILIGVGMFVWEGVLWLRDGYWTTSTLFGVLRRFSHWSRMSPEDLDGMRGVHRIVDWIGDLPTSLAALAVGICLAWKGNDRLADAEVAAPSARIGRS